MNYLLISITVVDGNTHKGAFSLADLLKSQLNLGYILIETQLMTLKHIFLKNAYGTNEGVNGLSGGTPSLKRLDSVENSKYNFLVRYVTNSSSFISMYLHVSTS